MRSTITKKRGLTAAVLSALPFARAQGTTPAKTTAACNDVAIFMARGNDAPYHDGRTSPFIDATCEKFQAQGNSCDYIDVVFDATKGADFCPTIQDGAVNGVTQVIEYNAQCPDTLIVINGYSQGAMVSGAVLSGGGDDACNVDSRTTGLNPASQAGRAVKAALLWGDVKHTANQAYNVLDGASKQAWPRTGANLARLNAYSSVLRSYCAAGDPVCANGDKIDEHLNYFELYTEEASSWVLSKLTPFLVKPSSSALPSSSSTLAPVVPETSISATVVPTASEITIEPSSVLTATKEADITIKPSSYVPSNATATPSDESATAYPVTIVPSPSQYYGNSTMSAIHTVTLVAVPYGTTGLPVRTVTPIAVTPDAITTKAPEYTAAPAECPVVYETVTEYEYVYV